MIKDVKIEKYQGKTIGIGVKLKNEMELFIPKITIENLFESGNHLIQNCYTTNKKLLPFLLKLKENS